MLDIKVIPNARKEEIVGFRGNELVIKLSCAPEKGKANERLLAFLSETFKIPKSRLALIRGAFSPRKKIRIKDFTEEKVAECIS
jgi:uncharacterized protein (TIGR00251 family)